MPSYKLKYFESKGRAEVCRLLFAIAGQEYEDIRYSQDEWAKEKTNTPFGQLPVLEIDGEQYAQSWGIIAFLAREFGVHGGTNLEQLKVDQVIGIIQDIYTHMLKLFYEKDKDKQITLADLAVFDTLDGKIDASVVESYPLVTENCKRVRTNEKIAQWLEKRPKTAY